MSKQARSKRLKNDPLRMRLFRDLVVLIMVTVAVLASASALLINDIKRDFAKVQLRTASTLLRDEVQGLLLPVAQQLLILRDGLRAHDLTPNDVKALNKQLMPALTHIDQIAGALLADATGREYFLRHEAAHWITRERSASSTTRASDPATARVTEWRNDDDPIRSRQEPSTHDPRQRPWFQAAVKQWQAAHELDPTSMPRPAPGNASEPEPRQAASALLTWSQPYQFISLDEPGITVATAWRQDDALQVLALDVTLARILTTIESLQANSTARGFLFDDEGGVYGSSYQTPTEAQTRAANRGRASMQLAGGLDASGFYSAEQRLGGATLFEAIAAWRDAGEPEDKPIRFESGGRFWWASFVPLEPMRRSAWVGVAYPGTGPIGLLQQRWPLFAGVALAIIALGIGLALLIVRRYSHRLRELPTLRIDTSQPETLLYDLIGRGESTHLEFKSTMRLNLRSGKNDKAIELAWLKGVAAFLNSEGGILLLGVADDGEVLGLAGDGFTNDDKCLLHFKNLVNQHLGAEAMRHLRFRLFQLEDKQIGAIECEPADIPVYLRTGHGESFLIRTGPSNAELPISRALGYIASRF